MSFELAFVDSPTVTAEFAAAYTGATGAGVTFSGAVDTVDQLPTTGITGDLYAVLSEGVGYIWDGSGWTNIGPILGPKGDKGDKGDRGDIGPMSTDLTYEHIQALPEATWTINHPLNKIPSVTVIDSSGSVVEGEVEYPSSATAVVRFAAAFSGKAYLN